MGRLSWNILNPTTCIFVGSWQRVSAHTEEGRAGLTWWKPKRRNSSSHQKLVEADRTLPEILWRKHVPADTVISDFRIWITNKSQPCWSKDERRLALLVMPRFCHKWSPCPSHVNSPDLRRANPEIGQGPMTQPKREIMGGDSQILPLGHLLRKYGEFGPV